MVYARRLLSNILGFICLFLLLARPADSQTTKPNIVFILVDNVAWGDFGGIYLRRGWTPRPCLVRHSEDEYKAYSSPIGNTRAFGGAWTLGIPKK